MLIKLLLELINMCGICIEMKKLIRNGDKAGAVSAHLSPAFSRANGLGREVFCGFLVSGIVTNRKQKIPSQITGKIMIKLIRIVITIYVVLMLSLRGFMVYREFINLLCLFALSFRLSTSPLTICLNFYLVFYQVF